MALSKLEDFMGLGTNTLIDFLTVRGLKTTGKKAELVARAFSAVELNLPIIQSSEQQQIIIKTEYEKKLALYQIKDPLTVELSKHSDDITNWPNIHFGNIIEYILNVRDFESDYIGRYKDEKAYSYWDSGFVGKLTSYSPEDKTNKVIIFGTVRSSLTATASHNVWILFQISPVKILTCSCSCMAGSSQSCNHAIAVMYKIEYAEKSGYLNPACTSMPCQWNQSTKRDIEPQMVKDITIRKKLRSSTSLSQEEDREQSRREELTVFQPVLPVYRDIDEEQLSLLLHNLNIVTPESVLFKSIPMEIEKDVEVEMSLERAAEKVLNNSVGDNDKIFNEFLTTLPMDLKGVQRIEEKTRGQGNNSLWKIARLGRLTASIHHDIFTKVNSLSRATCSIIRPKTTPLLKKIMGKDSDLGNIDAIKWGRENEVEALKQFVVSEALKHIDYKVKSCGLFLNRNKPYIGASPDGIFSCKCHRDAVIEIKCPYKIRDLTLTEAVDMKKCDHLQIVNGEVKLKKSHKYYTQIISQMAMTELKNGYFVTWTKKEILVENVVFDETHWKKIEQNLTIFFKAFVCPYLLRFKVFNICGKCEDILLEPDEINEKEKAEQGSIQCERCQLNFHLKCQNVTDQGMAQYKDWHCYRCIIDINN